MNKISVFGAGGFVGNNFCTMFPNKTIKMNRESLVSCTPELIWLISTTDNYNVFSNVHLDIDTNLSLFVDALESSKKFYGNSLVVNLVSSWFVYSDKEIPALESSCCNPKGFYGSTALCRENLLISYCNTFGMSYRIFRLANVLGIGDNKISKKKNALQFFVREIVNNRPVELYYPDRTVRDYISVDDVCSAINLIISFDKTKNHIYNIGNEVPIKFKDCIDYVVHRTGNNPVKEVERSEFHKAVQIDTMYLNNSKIKNLGYKQTKIIWQILDELIDYYTEEKNGRK